MLQIKVEFDHILNEVKEHWEEVIYTEKSIISRTELVHTAFKSFRAEKFPDIEVSKEAIKNLKIRNQSDKEVFLPE